MANPVAQLRAELTLAFAGSGVGVFSYPPSTVTPPAIVLVPDEPYVEPIGLGPGTNLRVRYRVTVAVAAIDNPASLDKLETLVTAIYTLAPKGVVVGLTSRPALTQVGPTELLTCEIDLEATISTT